MSHNHAEHAEAASVAALGRLQRGLFAQLELLQRDVRTLDAPVLESTVRAMVEDHVDRFADDLRERHDRLPDVGFINASYDDDAEGSAC